MPFPLEFQFVQEAEAKLGRKLPASYVAQLCRCNGGQVSAGRNPWGRDTFDLHPILDTTDRKRMARTCNDIIRETRVAKELSDYFPSEALAIGNNGGGDLLVLLPTTDGTRFADAIYWWDHENGDVNQLANDFAELDYSV